MDLTTLDVVKDWLSITSGDDDALLNRLITQVSGAALNYLQRPSLTRATYTELRDGVNNQRMVLRNWPVVTLTSLSINGTNIPPASSVMSPGYTLATWDGTSSGIPQELTLRGYTYCRGSSNVQIIYDAGYALLNQSFTIPSGAAITTQCVLGTWAQDDGIKTTTGISFTAVAQNISPAQGQYNVVPGLDGAATYTFNAADIGTSLLISYSFIPATLENGVIEWVGERYRYKQRIGQRSKSVGGTETTSYNLAGMPDYIQQMLDGYKKFLPV